MGKRVDYVSRVVDGELDLSMSELQEVPVRDIALAKKGSTLDLSNNRLTSLGKNFAILTHLVKLDLSKNQITFLPPNFGDLILLKHLDLYCNKLNHLPLSFGRLKNLNWLDLKNNPLVPDLQAIAGPCQDSEQCRNCAKRVVQVLAESQRRADEAREKQEEELKRKEMAEKAAQKKEQQQKSKKNKQNEGKKKNVENGAKPQEHQRNQQQKKKEKRQAKLQVSEGPTLLNIIVKRIIFFSFFISFMLFILYTFDKEGYKSFQERTAYGWNATKSVLPARTLVWAEEVSTFLNTDPRVKNHWANLCDIVLVIRNRAGEYIHAFSLVLPEYVGDLKQFFGNDTETT